MLVGRAVILAHETNSLAVSTVCQAAPPFHEYCSLEMDLSHTTHSQICFSADFVVRQEQKETNLKHCINWLAAILSSDRFVFNLSFVFTFGESVTPGEVSS